MFRRRRNDQRARSFRHGFRRLFAIEVEGDETAVCDAAAVVLEVDFDDVGARGNGGGRRDLVAFLAVPVVLEYWLALLDEESPATGDATLGGDDSIAACLLNVDVAVMVKEVFAVLATELSGSAFALTPSG
jgi:hypothetical protein